MKKSALCFSLVAVIAQAPRAWAAPYASAVTVTGDNVSFVLNESADSVRVVFNDGASTLTIGTSPEPAGTKTFSKAGFTSFRIEVEKNAGPGWKSGVLQQISSDNNDLVKFANGRGVAVNRLPDTGPLFGRIYTSVGGTGVAAPVGSPTPTTRATDEGLYMLNADMTAPALGTGPFTATISFDSAAVATAAESPYRLSVGTGGDLFIADWSENKGSLYKCSGDLTNGKNVLGGPFISSPATTNFPVGDERLHGSIAAVVTEGSEAGGDLRVWVIDEDLQTNKNASGASGMTMRNSIWLWDLTLNAPAELPMTSAPQLYTTTAPATDRPGSGIGFASQTSDLARGPDGIFYKLQRRANGLESAVFAIRDDGLTGTPIVSHPAATVTGSLPAFRAFSQDNSVIDPFVESVAVDISNDGWMVVLRRADNALHLVKVADGLMDFSTYTLLYPKPTTGVGRDIAFDAAGNLYSLSSGQALLRVYAPGGHTLATTTSSGAFTITEVTPPIPASPLELRPTINSVTRTGNDLTINVTSRLGIGIPVGGTLVLQRTNNLASGPWTTMVNPASPGTPIWSIAGDPPTFTMKALNAFTTENGFFYRVKRN